MDDEKVVLDEISISTGENPANKIIRKAIDNKNNNTDKFKEYTSNFYSRGLFKVKNAPEKILGRSLGDLGGGLDSTRTGIIYLSETVSEITFKKTQKNLKKRFLLQKSVVQIMGLVLIELKRQILIFIVILFLWRKIT